MVKFRYLDSVADAITASSGNKVSYYMDAGMLTRISREIKAKAAAL